MIGELGPFFLIAAAAGGIAYALLYPLLTGEKRLEERKKAFAAGPEPTRAVRAAPTARTKREQVAQSLKEVEAREKARGKLTLEDKFSQAGLKIDRKKFYLFSLISAGAVGFIAMTAVGNPIASLPGMLVGGLGLPHWFLGFRRNRRIKAFLIEFPNALDVITRGLKSGLPLNDCVRIISTEAAEPVRSEFRAIMDAQALGISLGEAIEDLYRRIPVPEANYFAIIVTIQQKSGGNLAESLGNMSKVVRERRKLKGKIQALSAEAKSSAGIIGMMPPSVAGLVYLTTPSYIEKLWVTQAGLFTLVGCAIWMLMGILVMRKMINFDI
jgi:tight adherence protein B